MAYLRDLSLSEQAHWKVHITALANDNSSAKTTINRYQTSVVLLPKIKHPAYIHDWYEKPEMRTRIEGWD